MPSPYRYLFSRISGEGKFFVLHDKAYQWIEALTIAFNVIDVALSLGDSYSPFTKQRLPPEMYACNNQVIVLLSRI
jgi:hypothetical protein